MNLFFNGKHSIVQGISNGTGCFHVKEYIDDSDELCRYSNDGIYWLENSTKELFEVLNKGIGVVLDLSKLLCD